MMTVSRGAVVTTGREALRGRHAIHDEGGKRQPMVFAHGFGCDQKMWRFVKPAFEESHRTILFDYVGSGRSDWEAYDEHRYRRLEDYARDVVEILDGLDLRDVVFVGHSVSAIIGALAAIQAPERFARLVMIGPSPCYLNDGDYQGGFARADLEGLLDLMEKNNVGWASYLAPIVMGNPGRPDLVNELESSFCGGDPRATHGFARATFMADNRADLPRVMTPAAILQCAQDSIAPAAVGEYMRRHLPRSTLVQLEATGHCPHMSHPAETIAVMKRLLARTE